MAMCQTFQPKKLQDTVPISTLLELQDENPDIKYIIENIIYNRPFELFQLDDINKLSEIPVFYNILKNKIEKIYEINIINKEDIYNSFISYIIDYITELFCDYIKINPEFNIKNIIINGGIIYNIELIFTSKVDDYIGRYIFSSATLYGFCGPTWNNTILLPLINCSHKRLYHTLMNMINFRHSNQLLTLTSIKLIKIISSSIDTDEPDKIINIVNL